MDKFQPWMRWLAVAAAAGALALAFFSPHRPESASAPDEPARPAATNASPVESPSPSQLAVYVCGAVRKAGVFRLAQGSRVVDAISVAGGLAADAEPEAINLAEPLVDGMKVEVPKKGAEATAFRTTSGRATHRSSAHRSSSRRSQGSGRSGAHKLQPGQTIDINTAGEAELVQLPGVGPGLARRIVKYREENGPFQLVDDLQNVSGIGPSKFAKLEAYVRL